MKLKKTTVASVSAMLLFSSILEADIAVGVEYPILSSFTETIDYDGSSAIEKDLSYSTPKLSLSFGTPGSALLSFYYETGDREYDEGDSETFSEVGMEFKGYLGSSKTFFPTIKVAAGIGAVDLETATYDYYSNSVVIEKETVNAVMVGLGVGVSYFVTDHLELTAGVDGKVRYFDTDEYENDEVGYEVTVGMNFWFNGIGQPAVVTHPTPKPVETGNTNTQFEF